MNFAANFWDLANTLANLHLDVGGDGLCANYLWYSQLFGFVYFFCDKQARK